MARILIAVPTYENITPDTFKALWDMDKDGHECLFEFVRGYDCAAARNNIAQKAIGFAADYVLMVDNDVTPSADALKCLLSHDVDVVLGYYAHRTKGRPYDGRTCVCRLLMPEGVPYFGYPAESQYTGQELREKRESGEYLVQIHGGGMGCALIKESVFHEFAFPWFKWVTYDDGGVLSEDLYFCEQLKNECIPVYADTRVECGHVFRNVQHCD